VLGIGSDQRGLSHQAVLLRISVAQRIIGGGSTRGHISSGCGVSEEAKNLAGNVLRLIQIRLTTPSLKKSQLFVKHNGRKARVADSQFNKRAELFVGMHNETPSVVAMRVSNPD
jgi:hypothetical protein